jgi:hypothetical protein
MKLYTFYSPSHKEIYERYFLESFNRHLSEDFELIAQADQQITENGSFSDPNVSGVWADKITLLKEAIKANYGSWFVYADCDIQFFGNIMQDIEDRIEPGLDIICQEDCGTICAGFMAINASLKMYNFMNTVELYHRQSNDQIVINQLRNMITFKLLPRDRYYTVGNYNRGMVWNDGDPIIGTENAVMHHANFTVGVTNKLAMLDQVKKIKSV